MLRTLALALVAFCLVGVAPASAHGPRSDARPRHPAAWRHHGPYYYGPYYYAPAPWPPSYYYPDDVVVPAPAPVIVPPPPFAVRPRYVGPHWRHRW